MPASRPFPARYADIFAGILVGGQGRRLGGVDKARLQVGAHTTLTRLIEVLTPRVETILLAGRAGQTFAEAEARLVADRVPGAGPLGGLDALLAAAPQTWCLLIACDLVRFDAALLDLLAAARAPECLAVLLRSEQGLEPTCSLYHRAAGRAVAQALATGERALHRVALALPHVSVPVPAALKAGLTNVNTPDELPT